MVHGSMTSIGQWLASRGLEKYAGAFAEAEIDLEVLRDLTEADLENLGVSLGARKKMLRAIAELGAAEALANKAQTSSPADARPEAERRQLTVAFADMVGSTALSQRMDPEELREVIRGFQDAAAVAVARFDGCVAKFMGDGLLAYFGWPRAHEDDAERAVRAGLAIAKATAALRAPGGEALAARVGIATGLVVVGELIGEGAAQEQVVVGETPNLAARLQAEAEPGQVVIAEATRRLAAGDFDLAPLGRRTLKGIVGEVEAHVVLAERHATSRFEARAEGALHPIYGRDEELVLLTERWRQARASESQGVLLVGEAGIGKSRILRALLDSLKDEPHTRLQYQCSPFHADSAFWPVTQQLTHAAGFASVDTSKGRLDKLEVLLAQAGTKAAIDAPLIAAMMGLDGTARYGPLTLAPAALRTRTLQALVDQLLGLAAQRPVILVLEDAHWIDPTTLELIERVLDAVAEAPVLVMLTSRPDNQPALAAHPNVTRVALDRLGREGVEAIVARLGGATLPAATVAAIVARADGVPLFVEELTKAVLESGETRVPATLHDTLMARLDRTGWVKEIAQTAACIGREFDFALLAAVVGRPEAELARGMDRLGAAELVYRRGFGTGTHYVFKHALVRDAAYESLLKSRRQRIHARLVTALEGEGAATPPEILARHAELAGMTDRAVEEYRRAGAAAVARPAYAEAVANYDAALRLLATLDKGRAGDERALAIEIPRGQALMAGSGYAAAETRDAFEHARALAEKIGDARSLFHADYGLWAASQVHGDLPDAEARGRRALAACETHDPADVRTVAHLMVGMSLVSMGRFAEGASHLQESIALYDPERHADHPQRFSSHTRATSLIQLAIALWCQGAVDAALADMESSLAMSRQLESGLARRQVLGHAGALKTMIDPAGANEVIEELLVSSLRDGAPIWQARARSLRVGVLTAQGDPRGALDDAAVGRDLLDRSGARTGQPLYLGFAAQAQIALGRFDDAAASLRDIDVMIEDGQRWAESNVRCIEGDLMLARGDVAAAETCWRRAIAIARAQGAASWELRAATRLARCLADRGAPSDAATLLAPVLVKIDGGRATPDVIVATALLRKLGTSP
jgi:class 3 adenylate cyclase/tetratricopeptide (TPR) repeat protein